VPIGYYRAKVDQERVVAQGLVPWTIVQATQFHELVSQWFTASARYRVLPAPVMPLQTVAAAEVARVLADATESAPRGGRISVAGPQISSMRELARTWRSAAGRSAVLVRVPLPGKLGRALRAGALTSPNADVTGSITFADWVGRSASESMFDSPS
jgi:uncharacterized protein YbjT (DUF2867 family)